MKKIQKREQVTRLYDAYVANDGTEFRDEKECKKYEESARCVLGIKYSKMVVTKTDEYSLSGFGTEDNRVDIVKPTTEADYDVLMQLWVLDHSYLVNDPNHKERVEEALNLIRRAINEKDYLFVGLGCEGDCFYLLGTRNSIKERFEKFCE